MGIDSNPFSAREKDVVKLLLQGKSNKQIALELGVNPMSRRIPMKSLLYLMGGGLLTVLLVVALVLANPPTKKFDLAPTQTTASHATEEAEVRELVENFGKRLQTVSLLSADAAQEMQKQYADFASPALLETWMKDVTKAPGRIVSSPWPDRIEITALSKEGADQYVLTGFVIEVTSVEMVNGGAAARILVRMVVQREQGRWLITEYTEEQ